MLWLSVGLNTTARRKVSARRGLARGGGHGGLRLSLADPQHDGQGRAGGNVFGQARVDLQHTHGSAAKPSGASVPRYFSSTRSTLEVGRSIPASRCSNVDWPEPDGPSSTANSPLAISRSMPLTARITSEPITYSRASAWMELACAGLVFNCVAENVVVIPNIASYKWIVDDVQRRNTPRAREQLHASGKAIQSLDDGGLEKIILLVSNPCCLARSRICCRSWAFIVSLRLRTQR